MFFSIIVTVIAFGIMVILHEAGHFFTAKRFGVTVHEFSVGMGPLLFKRRKGETQYSLRLLPLGGYVRLEGEEDSSDDPNAFLNISPIKRIIVLAAGAFMNIMLGFLCFVIINNVYSYVQTPVISEIIENSSAEEAGLMAGDEIIRLGNTRVYTQSDVELFKLTAPQKFEIDYKRDGKNQKTVIELTESGVIGFKGSVKKLSFPQTFQYSYYDTRYVVKAVLVSLRLLFTGGAKVSDMSGPVGIVQVVDEVKTDAEGYGALALIMQMLMLFAMISVNLGVFNLLPFPALDGGSIIFSFIELVTRKKLKPEVLGYINLIGLALILGLGLFITYSDIMKLL